MRTVSVILLSDFCSGSTALQSELTKSPAIRRSKAVETQYWCKAAALLGMPQHDIMSSILPMAADVARKELINFLSDNLPHYCPPNDDEMLIFDGWRRLCVNYSPFFFEKSPHHLHYWSALQLIYRGMHSLKDIDFMFIGLIRNPLDTLYSRWRQWRNDPYKAQWLWYNAYKNLFRFQELAGEKLFICKYEDLVTQKKALFTLLEFLGTKQKPEERSSLHPESIGRWRKDPYFTFEMDPAVVKFSESLGYDAKETQGRTWRMWPLYWRFAKLKFRVGEWKRHYAGN